VNHSRYNIASICIYFVTCIHNIVVRYQYFSYECKLLEGKVLVIRVFSTYLVTKHPRDPLEMDLNGIDIEDLPELSLGEGS
jgi:hypothetical protein